MSNKGLLTVIAILLLGIFALILVEVSHETPAEEFTRSFSEMAGDISNNFDNNSTN